MGEVSYELLEEIMTKKEKTFYQELGKRVAELRKQNQITQVQMAKELGVSQQQIASYEAGRVKIPVWALPKLAVVLATPIDEIVGVKQRSKRGPASKLQQQLDLIRTLPRTKQRFVIEMLDTVIAQQQRQSG